MGGYYHHLQQQHHQRRYHDDDLHCYDAADASLDASSSAASLVGDGDDDESRPYLCLAQL